MSVLCFSFINSDLTKCLLKGRGDSYLCIQGARQTCTTLIIAGRSAQTLPQLCMISWAPNGLCACLQAISSFIMWRFIRTYSTRFDHWRSTTLFSQRCMFLKALTVTFHAQTSQVLCAEMKKCSSWIDYHRGSTQKVESLINTCWRRMG